MIMVMRYNYRNDWTKGFYSDHFNEKDIVEMEPSIIAKMFIDKQNSFNYTDYLLLYKDDNNGWAEITEVLKLDIFCSSKYKFSFINLENLS